MVLALTLGLFQSIEVLGVDVADEICSGFVDVVVSFGAWLGIFSTDFTDQIDFDVLEVHKFEHINFSNCLRIWSLAPVIEKLSDLSFNIVNSLSQNIAVFSWARASRGIRRLWVMINVVLNARQKLCEMGEEMRSWVSMIVSLLVFVWASDVILVEVNFLGEWWISNLSRDSANSGCLNWSRSQGKQSWSCDEDGFHFDLRGTLEYLNMKNTQNESIYSG